MCTCVVGAGRNNYQLLGEPETEKVQTILLEGGKTRTGSGKGNRILFPLPQGPAGLNLGIHCNVGLGVERSGKALTSHELDPTQGDRM